MQATVRSGDKSYYSLPLIEAKVTLQPATTQLSCPASPEVPHRSFINGREDAMAQYIVVTLSVV